MMRNGELGKCCLVMKKVGREYQKTTHRYGKRFEQTAVCSEDVTITAKLSQ